MSIRLQLTMTTVRMAMSLASAKDNPADREVARARCVTEVTIVRVGSGVYADGCPCCEPALTDNISPGCQPTPVLGNPRKLYPQPVCSQAPVPRHEATRIQPHAASPRPVCPSLWSHLRFMPGRYAFFAPPMARCAMSPDYPSYRFWASSG